MLLKPNGSLDCLVYWIHLKSHTDFYTEGYIGVTTKTAEERFLEHYESYKKNRFRSKMLNLHKAFDKFGLQGLRVCTILFSSKKHCYEIERHLRPYPNIGYNTNRGGKC